MLLQITAGVAITTMAITLWMAFYLFARGFPSKITMRVVIVLLALSVFFFGAYNNIFHQVAGTAAWRAVLLVLALGSWYSLTYQLMNVQSRTRFRWLERGMYILAILTIVSLLQPGSFIDEEGNALHVSHMAKGTPNIVYGIFQFSISICILLNLLIDNRIGLTSQGKYFLLASIFPSGSVIYGVIALTSPNPAPRVIQDMLIFSGVFLLGLSTALHQTLVERRTKLQDFPISALTVLGLSALYAFLALRWGIPVERLSLVVGLSVLTLSLYDLVREFLERLRIRNESAFRKQLRRLESDTAGESTLQRHLQEGLNLLCQTLKASGGFIAVRRGEMFVVTASRNSLPEGSECSPELMACDDISRASEELSDIVWIAPAFDGQQQIAVVAIGRPKARVEYGTGDLDLLSEVAEQLGRIISLSNLQPQKKDQIQQLVVESQSNAAELSSAADEMLETMTVNPNAEFIKMVEDALRNLLDYIELGQSNLADWANVTGESHVERGKQLQHLLADAIESLRPAETRPGEPLPRLWYNYAVLHDAYVEGAQNREIMARLYISEGTFNRTRRNALRGLARMLMEKAALKTK